MNKFNTKLLKDRSKNNKLSELNETQSKEENGTIKFSSEPHNQKVKKCLLCIPISQHRLLKKFCAETDLKVSEFILLAIKEKLER
jgi:hypothetical protein